MQNWDLFLGLEALFNEWRYAKHVSHIRVTICLCAAINLRLDVDCSCSALSYPRYCPLTLTSCCNNGYWPPHRWLSARRGQQKGPVDPHTHTSNCEHTHCLTCNDKCQHTQSWGHQSHSQWQIAAKDNKTQCGVPEGLFEISHRVTQFHDVPPYPLYASIPFSIFTLALFYKVKSSVISIMWMLAPRSSHSSAQ